MNALHPAPPDTLDLTRTARALAAYDAAGEAFGLASVEQTDAAWERLQAARAAVGDAFALDTADRNDPDTARRAPIGWLRGLVRSQALETPLGAVPQGPATCARADWRTGLTAAEVGL